MAKCPVCYTVLNAGASGWTDDPLYTPLHFISSLRGSNPIRAKHILELQQRVNEYEAGFSGYSGLTRWTPIQARRFSPRPQYINELRQAIESVLGYVDYSLSDYLSQDMNGEPTRGISGWIGGSRLSSKIMVRAIHIEELRMPLNIPDLIVTDITITNQGVISGKGVYDIAYTVKNDGYRKAITNTGRIGIVGSNFIESEIIELGPVGNTLSLPSETVIHTVWYYDPFDAPRAFTVEATADINNVVKEIKENNNSLSKEFFDRVPVNKPDLTVTDITIIDLGVIDGNGTYDITYTVKNLGGPSPACNGLLRLAIEPAYLIVHAHNPEGFEIHDCSFRSPYGTPAPFNVGVYCDGSPLGPADGITSMMVDQGRHTIEVRFNGISLTQVVDFSTPTTKEITFDFPRTEITWKSVQHYKSVGDASGSGSTDDDFPPNHRHELFDVTGGQCHVGADTSTGDGGGGHVTGSAIGSCTNTGWDVDIHLEVTCTGTSPRAWTSAFAAGSTDNFIITQVPLCVGFDNWIKTPTLPTPPLPPPGPDSPYLWVLYPIIGDNIYHEDYLFDTHVRYATVYINNPQPVIVDAHVSCDEYTYVLCSVPYVLPM